MLDRSSVIILQAASEKKVENGEEYILRRPRYLQKLAIFSAYQVRLAIAVRGLKTSDKWSPLVRPARLLRFCFFASLLLCFFLSPILHL